MKIRTVIKTEDERFLMLVVIADRKKTQGIVGSMSDEGVYSTFTMPARGTASSDILNMLGLGEFQKDVILCALRKKSAKSMLRKLIEEHRLDERGQGIAFTVPMTGVLYGRKFTSFGAFSEEEATQMDGNKYEYDLILAVTNSGYSDQVMDAAKSVHPSGGTIVKGRETGLKDGGKFFGVNIQPEKEVVMILTPREFCDDIMETVMKKAGPRSKAGTFVVSIPVKDTAGLAPEFEK